MARAAPCVSAGQAMAARNSSALIAAIGSEMPSTPTRHATPSDGIHGASETHWKAGADRRRCRSPPRRSPAGPAARPPSRLPPGVPSASASGRSADAPAARRGTRMARVSISGPEKQHERATARGRAPTAREQRSSGARGRSAAAAGRARRFRPARPAPEGMPSAASSPRRSPRRASPSVEAATSATPRSTDAVGRRPRARARCVRTAAADRARQRVEHAVVERCGKARRRPRRVGPRRARSGAGSPSQSEARGRGRRGPRPGLRRASRTPGGKADSDEHQRTVTVSAVPEGGSRPRRGWRRASPHRREPERARRPGSGRRAAPSAGHRGRCRATCPSGGSACRQPGERLEARRVGGAQARRRA